jgi:hypothetical protein
MGVGCTSVNISNSRLQREDLVNLFNDLYDRTATTAGTITITSTYGGVAELTAADRLIATSKNWGIVG